VTEPAVSPSEFRETLARWASGVTVVTARDAQGPIGITVSSFSSLSLDPPLVLVCIDVAARSHDGLVAAEGFVVHVLSRDQDALSGRFARPGPEKFAEGDWTDGPFGAPVLPLGVSRLVCRRHDALRGGDHTILVGRVLEVARTDAPPLVYCDRGYHSIA
jgi:flavin reductase (DIM6/NTAB) family NADH-FMN oxidoreductase RutF